MASQPEVTSDFPPLPKYVDTVAEGKDLAPPPIPSDGAYTVFGIPRKLVEATPSLESQGLKTLFDATKQRKDEIKRLAEASRERFLELVAVLGNDSTEEAIMAKVHELDVCLINLLYLTNELREEQAKVALRDMLKCQVEAKKRASVTLEESSQMAQKRIKEAFQMETASGDVVMSVSDAKEASGESKAKPDTLEVAESIVEAEFKRLKGAA
jgi:hypothetical protein